MGKSQVNLSQMPPPGGSIWMGVDSRNHLFAPGLSPGCPGNWKSGLFPDLSSALTFAPAVQGYLAHQKPHIPRTLQ